MIHTAHQWVGQTEREEEPETAGREVEKMAAGWR